VFAPFFGIPASTSKGLAVISLRTGAPVVPVFIRRVDGGRHRVEFEAPLPFPAAGDVTGYTAAFNRTIEAAIRRAPEQWFWMHERWRTRPRAQAS
jgi:KDO2-lipid IV(A) lauroyltransferase